MQAHSNTTHIAHNGIACQITCGNCNYLLLVWYLWSLSTHGPLGNNFVTVYNMLFVIFRQKTVFSSRRPAFCYFISFSSKNEILLSIKTTSTKQVSVWCCLRLSDLMSKTCIHLIVTWHRNMGNTCSEIPEIFPQGVPASTIPEQ